MSRKRNVLITGTSKGIGLATAKLFLNEGFTVYGIDILPGEINHFNYNHIQCDMSIAADIIVSCMNINEPFEFIINNAGTDQSDKAIAVNLTSLFEIEDKFVTSDTDCVVNICSTSAHIGIENREYVASKGGVLAYTRQLAKKMATWGGRCVSISPGPVFTEMNGHIIDDVSKFKAVEAQNILHKWISPSEIADAIYFMCMNKSITGVDLLIDCGEHINHTEIK